jgi:hypothetical protein
MKMNIETENKQYRNMNTKLFPMVEIIIENKCCAATEYPAQTNKSVNRPKTGKFRTNILLLLTLVFASSTIYAQDFNGLSHDSILKIRAAAAAKTKPKNGGGGGIGVMSVNPGNKPAGSIAVNRDPAYQAMTPEQLIQEIFVRNGACATVFNVNTSIYGWNGISWGAARGLAYFNRADSNLSVPDLG